MGTRYALSGYRPEKWRNFGVLRCSTDASKHTASTRRNVAANSRRMYLARSAILPSSASFIPRPASRPRWTPATPVARGPTCPQRRSCCLAHQQDGAHDGAADDYAQDEDGEHQDAIQYQSVILWTMQGAELVMAGFLRLKIRVCGRQAASPEPHSSEAARLWPKRRHGMREKRTPTPSCPDLAAGRNGPKVDFC